MTDKIMTLIPILIGFMFSMIPASIILPTNYVIVWFLVVASIMISSIVYVHRLPNSTNEQPFRHGVNQE